MKQERFIIDTTLPIIIDIKGNTTKTADTNETLTMAILLFYKVCQPEMGKTFEERRHLEKLKNQLIDNPKKVKLTQEEIETVLKYVDKADLSEFFKGQIERVFLK